MASERISRKDKNQNIQVFVRMRPLNQRERDIKSLGVVEVVNNREIVVRQSQQTCHTKKFTFDRSFGPHSKQVEVYQDVVSPLIEEVLAGYNCTVFAYGQTGTGKTHTMVGENTGDEINWQDDPLAGIIPRALSQLFDELRISNTEYTIRVSYLELYNEELFDLLSTSDDNSKLRIYEDVTRKGANIINGLEEVTVYNKSEVFKIMAQGQERKRVASTLMNAQSSRSHTVFTITIHMKESQSSEGDELVKIGKLNLVDLAGSENISKAGSDIKRERARESVNINQSLLTLGRVITALVERHPHIPYRESKLTRLLQESLGGRTKTSIIATISPGHKDLEETMSTLEYAHRAKNIQNKPEINQKMTKKAMLKEFVEEIDRLKRDLQANRDKTGVYLTNETYTELTLTQEEQKKEIQELLLKKKAMEDERDKIEGVFKDMKMTLDKRNQVLQTTMKTLDATKGELVKTSNLLKSTEQQFLEQKHLVETHSATERKLSSQAQELVATTDTLTDHVACLQDNVDKRRTVEIKNLEVTKSYREQAAQERDAIENAVRTSVETHGDAVNDLMSNIDKHMNSSCEHLYENKEKLEVIVNSFVTAMNELTILKNTTQTNVTSASEQQCKLLEGCLVSCSEDVKTALDDLALDVASTVDGTTQLLVKGNVDKLIKDTFTTAIQKVQLYTKAHSTFKEKFHLSETARCDELQTQRCNRLESVEGRNKEINSFINQLNQDRALYETHISKQMTEIESDKRKTEERFKQLTNMIEQERELAVKKSNQQLSTLQVYKEMLENNISKTIEFQQKCMDMNRLQADLIERDYNENLYKGQVTVSCVEEYGRDICEGTSAISKDMEVMCCDTVKAVDDVSKQVFESLGQAKTRVQEEVTKTSEAVRERCNELSANTNRVVTNMATDTTQAMDTIVTTVEQTSSKSIQDVSSIANNVSLLITSAQTHARTMADALVSAQTTVSSLVHDVCTHTDKQANIEDVYLAQEYKTYSPTGRTPVRQEYKYNRQLASTSPHDRILARLRDSWQKNQQNNCIVIESDESQPCSDSESVESPESECSQTEVVSASDCRNIVKSKSDNDIFQNRQTNGQENRSISSRKPSKLRAPSNKKPLVERNVYQQ